MPPRLARRRLTTLPLAACLVASAAARAEVPKVALSDQHRAMCNVGVGDRLPAMTLSTPNGDPQPLAPLAGKRATVVVFYTHAAGGKTQAAGGKTQAARRETPTAGGDWGWMTRTLLADLGPDVAEPFGPQGVAVIAIAVGAPGEAITPPAPAGYLSLVDREGKAMAQIGAGRLPRVYVVDAGGVIRWFDLEYSNSTRRELRQTLAKLAGDSP